jgi:hypothetical protein
MEFPKLEKESSADYEKRTWMHRLHATPEGNVFIPPQAFKGCLDSVAKYLGTQIPGKGKATYTKNFEAGVMVPEGPVLPIKKEDVQGVWLFLPANGMVNSGKRVWKCMPMIPHWEVEIAYHILDDTVTKEVFEYHLEQAGRFIGIGFFRPHRRGYWGRFRTTKIDWV